MSKIGRLLVVLLPIIVYLFIWFVYHYGFDNGSAMVALIAWDVLIFVTLIAIFLILYWAYQWIKKG